ncbi:Glycine-tRNA ligase 1, mitochondrial [Smittium mucronatum]|uniref:glycine--tRNA ligase n=1 Tax=Smittium mucronatum TaxID=133383 RepID=A0A1R0GLZ9_9FUNG|nr:Glycine-tRNA ligase 1, mitochondrial [Smittium mucronatum]
MFEDKKIDRPTLEALLTNRFFFVPSFSIYGGVAGLYDYGPIGSALQQNLINLWRQHFVVEEDMLEMDGAIITPAEVLKTSGHVEKFTDFMCKDEVTLEVFRADHLVEAVLEARLESNKLARELSEKLNVSEEKANVSADGKKKKAAANKPTLLEDSVVAEYNEILAKIDNYDMKELGDIIVKYEVRNPATGNKVTPPVEFNLMFDSSIGPTGNLKGYLRPETAQSQFVNFSRLLEFNNQKMPFASAMVGKSFRNEISPRSGLLRVREFMMAEIEHYVDPLNKNHHKFSEVAHIKLNLLPANVQQSGSTKITVMTIGEAVSQKVIDNETLGYFLGRIFLFLEKIGIDNERLRFRQHMSNEMAHYACDCWDAEIHNSYGWIECIGCADRSAYDLTVHSKRTKEKLCVRENLETPIVYDALVCNLNKKLFGPKFRQNAKAIQDKLESLTQDELALVKEGLESNGKYNLEMSSGVHELTTELLSVDLQTFKENVREYTPNVIEPSFGLGRILYSLIEHSYYTRMESESRSVFRFNPLIAPFKVLVLPLLKNAAFRPILTQIARSLRSMGVPARVDDAASASIGRRYSRNDELGIPFAITVDYQSIESGLITLRERDTTTQIQADIKVILDLVVKLVNGSETWENIIKTHPVIETSAE